MTMKKSCILFLTFGCLTSITAGCSKEALPTSSTAATAAVTTAAVSMTAAPSAAVAVMETNEALPDPSDTLETYADQLASSAILEHYNDYFVPEECLAEGHLILEEDVSDGILTIYALTIYGGYSFHNVDYFVKSSGTGVIPAVMTFDLRLNSHTPLLSFETPEDGSGYSESIKNLFPEHLWDRVLTIQEDDRSALISMEQEYAKRYLSEIGRSALVGEYADFNHELLTDVGISTEVSNRLLEYEKEMGPYPTWHGSTEKLEQDIRYMYSVFYDEESSQIIYEKRVFDTMETVEKFVFDAETGEKRSDSL